MQEVKELTLVILEWCARQEKLERHLHIAESQVQRVLVILQGLGFVNNHASPLDIAETGLSVRVLG
jgi:hypothetical protein